MTTKLTLLALTLFFCPVAPVSAYYPEVDIRSYQRPTVIQKVRIKVNECYDYLERDFTERRYCKPDQFYLHLSNGEMRQVTEMQYNRNKVGQPLTR